MHRCIHLCGTSNKVRTLIFQGLRCIIHRTRDPRTAVISIHVPTLVTTLLRGSKNRIKGPCSFRVVKDGWGYLMNNPPYLNISKDRLLLVP